MSEIPSRLTALRAEMSARGLSHYLVPSADEHINEYLPPWRERRQFLSGFTGSAGDLLVGATDDETWLFTDGRYHIQADEELCGSGIGLQKVGAKGAKTLLSMATELAEEHGDAFVLGVDAMVVPVATWSALRKAIDGNVGTLRAVSPNLVDGVWADRPTPPTTPLIECPIEWTGRSVEDKLADIRESLSDCGADALVAVKLDQIAWLLNLRSLDDIPYNPVFESFLFLDPEAAHLFVRSPSARLPGDGVPGVVAHEYDEWPTFLDELGKRRVWIDPSGVTEGVRARLDGNDAVTVLTGDSPIELAKAHKNDAELECMQQANLMASVAKTRALLWLRRQIADGATVTERGFAEKLESFYAGVDGFRGLSFNTISSTGEHGAIIHYSAADETPLRPGELFLIDSGIQMNGGTTDDTRTVIVGSDVTDEQRRRYTAVLQAHIRGANQVFPRGTAGAAIDAITRSALWSRQLQYDHGTGHGVGAFLNVHEGPFGIAETSRRSYASRKLDVGMVTSIEPGYYASEFGGIRIENLYHVEEASEADGRRWLRFAPLTWIPLDPALTDDGALDVSDREWISWYHGECVSRLGPYLSDDERSELTALVG